MTWEISSVLQELEVLYTPWPIYRIVVSAHAHSKFFESISTQVIEKQASPITSGTLLHVTHTKIPRSVIASTSLTCEIDVLDCLQCPAFVATSSDWADLPKGNSSAGATYRPCPSVSAKKRTDCHACPRPWQASTGSCHHTTATPCHVIPAMIPSEGITIIGDAVQGCHWNVLRIIFSISTVLSRQWLQHYCKPGYLCSTARCTRVCW